MHPSTYSVGMITLPDGRQAGVLTESGEALPDALTAVDDTLAADAALRMLRQGRVLLWTGSFPNGRNLLAALKRRLAPTAPPSTVQELGARWRDNRAQIGRTAELLGALMVVVEPDGEVKSRRAPQTSEAVRLAWGHAPHPRLVSINNLLGALSAAEWTRKGLEVAGLEGRLTPRYGVFSPTRSAYVALARELEVRDQSLIDVGCGTGVLAFVLLQAGARSAVGTDQDPRAIECAVDNAAQLGLSERFQAREADLFPANERADTIIFNAPWMPETPRTRLDRSVFDEDGATLERFLADAPGHLEPGGQVALLLSDLPERLGLRAPDTVEALASRCGLNVDRVHEARARHGRTQQPSDPLHQARAAERVRMFLLSAA